MSNNEESKTAASVPCPNCRKAIEWSTSNPFRPFCCKRCQLIDLGKWADESHSIAGEPAYVDEIDSVNNRES